MSFACCVSAAGLAGLHCKTASRWPTSPGMSIGKFRDCRSRFVPADFVTPIPRKRPRQNLSPQNARRKLSSTAGSFMKSLGIHSSVFSGGVEADVDSQEMLPGTTSFPALALERYDGSIVRVPPPPPQLTPGSAGAGIFSNYEEALFVDSGRSDSDDSTTADLSSTPLGVPIDCNRTSLSPSPMKGARARLHVDGSPKTIPFSATPTPDGSSDENSAADDDDLTTMTYGESVCDEANNPAGGMWDEAPKREQVFHDKEPHYTPPGLSRSTVLPGPLESIKLDIPCVHRRRERAHLIGRVAKVAWDSGVVFVAYVRFDVNCAASSVHLRTRRRCVNVQFLSFFCLNALLEFHEL